MLTLLRAGCANADPGLSGLQGYAWLMLFFLGLAIAVIAMVAFYIFKASRRQKPGILFRIILVVLLILGSPVLFTAFTARGFDAYIFSALALYLALLTVGLLLFLKSRPIVFTALGIVAVAYLITGSQKVSFTAYRIVDNVFSTPSYELAERFGISFIRTTDNQLYRLVERNLPREELFKKGDLMQIKERSQTDENQALFVISRIGNSSQYYSYLRNYVEPMLLIPFETVTIEKNQPHYISRAELLGDDWKATNREISSALYHGCCNADWIAELIRRGADPTEIASGSRNALQHLADDIERHEGITETAAVLINAGVAVNQQDEWGKTALYLAVDGADYRYFQKPELAARFVAFIRLLLDKGADPDIADKYGNTPLYEAVVSRRYELARLLLQYGADPNIVKAYNSGALSSSAFIRATKDLASATDDSHRAALVQLLQDMER